MKKQRITLERNEYLFLKELIKKSEYTDTTSQKCLDILRKEMEVALVLDEAEMPDDMVRLHSIVDVETSYGPKYNLQIVLPAERDVAQNKISVLSPMGSGLIGYRRGDIVKWMLPKGKGKIKILNVKDESETMAES